MKKNPQLKDVKFKIKDKASEKVTSAEQSYEGQNYDTMLHAWMGKFTSWLSPASVGMATFDWLSHLAMSPAKLNKLTQKACEDTAFFALKLACPEALASSSKPRVRDPRFKDDAWETFPFNLYSQAFLIYESWWKDATSGIKGVSKHHLDMVNFTARQILDMCSPYNFPLTNPQVLTATVEKGGANFTAGLKNWVEDCYRVAYQLPPEGSENFPVGEVVAVTAGNVVYRNNLIELIQYAPTTKEVYAEPILLIPAWIMKYYILDLSPHNSLVKYLVDKGHTVFMISWKNPTGEDRNLGLEDYLSSGVMCALQTISEIVPDKKIHATGYCLGGTLLMIAAAAMAALGDEHLKTITLFAAQIDFGDPGELSLFIDQSQISYLEDIMWEKGYLDGSQMAWAFSMLRSNDLIWSRMLHDYLLGERRPMNDLIAWDHDTTRLPFRMHSQYLHSLFLNNDLVRGRYEVNKKRIALVDIQEPMFVVATQKDHVSPWRSVYRVELYTTTEVSFVLTSGGHNAGIISEPGHHGRSYQMSTRKAGDKYKSSDTWLENAEKFPGSWWPAWEQWLVEHSSGKIALPSMGNPKKDDAILCEAPGLYVLDK
jgi:polyhydroxyalkanoate synthase subunit PhaC